MLNISINLDNASEMIAHQHTLLTKQKALLVAISGIDGSGKGYITSKLDSLLAQQNLRIATIGIDGWLNLPAKRFSQMNRAEHFYQNAVRFGELFGQLIFPLRDRRSIHLEADYAEETASGYRKHIYQFTDIDVILLEGIYLLKRQFQSTYDLSFWIECSFETALSRAIAHRRATS